MKTFVVTGSTKGIGLAIVEALINKYQDVKIFMSYGHDAASADSCKKKWGNLVDVYQVDLGSYKEMQEYCAYIRKNTSTIDGLVLNAGIGYKASLENLDIEEWERVMRVNVNVPIFMIKELLPNLKAHSAIVMAGSIMGDIPHSGSLVYGVSKAAVHAAVKNLMKFLADRKIRINAIAPGFTESEWHKGKPQEFFDRIASKIAIQRWGATRGGSTGIFVRARE